MKNPSSWTPADLHRHLQHALDVEFWTVPLYLTALYSIRGLNRLKPADYPDAARLMQSVVIQEMLHMEIVCNLSHALGYAPRFHAPGYRDGKSIPFIHPVKESLPEHLRGYITRPGALGEQTLKLFCVIESPHEAEEVKWEERSGYRHIGEMYAALKEGVQHLWTACYVGAEKNTRQKVSFRDYEGMHRGRHGFSQVVDSPESAMKAMDAIVEQGEGASRGAVPKDFRPPVPGKENDPDPGWYRGELSHYHKFSRLLQHPEKLPEVYPVTNENGSAAKQQLKAAYRDFLAELQASFQAEGREMSPGFWGKMTALTRAITAVWESGSVPDFDMA